MMVITSHQRILMGLMALLMATAPLQAGWKDWFDKPTISGRTALVATSAAAFAVISYIVYKRWNAKAIAVPASCADARSDKSAELPMPASSQNSESLSNHEFIPWTDAQGWNEEPLIPLQQYALNEHVAWSQDRSWVQNKKQVVFAQDVVDGKPRQVSSAVIVRRPWQESFDNLCAHLVALVIAKKDDTFSLQGGQSYKFAALLIELSTNVIVRDRNGRRAFDRDFVATFHKLDRRIAGILRNMSPYIKIDPRMKFYYDSTQRWIDTARNNIKLLREQQTTQA